MKTLEPMILMLRGHGSSIRAPLPHVLDVDYMGLVTAREAVEAWYPPAHQHYSIFDAHSPEGISWILCNDSFNVGLNPANILREFTVNFDLDNLNTSLDVEVDVERIQPLLDLLHIIVKKKGFHLQIYLSQQHIRLNLWPAYFNMFNPILLAFESAGSTVSVSWSYCFREGRRLRLQWDLTDMIREGVADKDVMKRWLEENEFMIAPEHKDYLREDNAN